ncbi:carbon-nitrogen hydrolase family protein [Amycolatopsis saalfeldensis]|uniref:Predicted amidohydrolase n=1 Tax=Amycolatopsis saalfeldensis TaxID=394193 RepID=A0A1H8XXW3_9PSEU|nr:carbon-nitrogen hydrolase family protein [Amycolatopsis saalfeldensis]SEP44602.1 Predicted amidohydrolase [Amycolatopsis saalfeldensis]
MDFPAAVAQFASGPDKQLNLKSATGAVDTAVRAGARLVVLPENSMYAAPDPAEDLTAHAEDLDGPFVTALSVAARAAGITVVAGLTERLPEPARPANTLVAIGADGAIRAVYRKVHLYDAFGYRESDHITPADITEPAVFDVDGLRWGMLTCYDLRFPEAARYLVDAGAVALALPAAWLAGPAKEDHWQVLARARAIENTAYVLAAGQTGPVCCGQSIIVDPMGIVVAGAGEAPGVAVATVSSTRLEEVRLTNPSLGNRRFQVEPARLAPR